MIDIMFFLALILLNFCKFCTYTSLPWQQDRKWWMLVSIFTWLPTSRDIASRRPTCFLAYSECIGESSHQAMGQIPSVVRFYKNRALLRWGVSSFPAFDEISRFGKCARLCLRQELFVSKVTCIWCNYVVDFHHTGRC